MLLELRHVGKLTAHVHDHDAQTPHVNGTTEADISKGHLWGTKLHRAYRKTFVFHISAAKGSWEDRLRLCMKEFRWTALLITITRMGLMPAPVCTRYNIQHRTYDLVKHQTSSL